MCGTHHWNLLAFQWGLVLVLRWRPLGELLSTNDPWGWDFSGGSMSWIRFPISWVQAWSLTVAPQLHRSHSTDDKTLRRLVKTMLNIPEQSKKLTPKSSDIYGKFSEPVVGSVGSAQSQIWPYSIQYLVCTPKVHSCPRSLQSQANCGGWICCTCSFRS